MPFHVMLIPTLGCPSNCSYCWSSEEDSPVMSIETIEEVVKWLKNFRKEPVTFTFHGGEPLLAGPDFYRKALALLAEGLGHQKIAFALQTNLWKIENGKHHKSALNALAAKLLRIVYWVLKNDKEYKVQSV